MKKTIPEPANSGEFVEMRVGVVNKTSQDISAWRNQVLSSLEKTGKMPEELAEFFEVTRVENKGQVSFVLNYPKSEGNYMNAPNPTPTTLHPEFRSLAKRKDALLIPAPFQASGTLTEVLAKWANALQAEAPKDLRLAPSRLAFGPKSGALTIDAGQGTRWGYTYHAVGQLFAKTNSDAPTGALTKTFAWVQAPGTRTKLWSEDILERGNKTRVIIVRLAKDVHNVDPDLRDTIYMRACVSDSHSLGEGDDALIITALKESLSYEHMLQFRGGKASIFRDPSNISTLRVDSHYQLPNSARLRLRVSNSEVGLQSAQHNLSVAFEIPFDKGDGLTEATSFEILLTGKSSFGRAIHKGRGTSILFDGLAENLAFQTARAQSALPLLASEVSETSLHSRVAEAQGAKDWADFSPELLARIDAIQMAIQSQGIAQVGTLLNHACALAYLGFGHAASEIYEGVGK